MASTSVDGLMLGDTADVADYGEYQFGALVAKGREGTDNDLVQFDAAYGFDERFQLQAEFDQKRFIDGGLDHAFTAGIGYQLLCRDDRPRVRMDLGFHHDGGNGPDFGFVAGQGHRLLAWQLGLHHSTAISSTRYNAAVILGERYLPVVFESAGSDSDAGWDRSTSWAIYPVNSEPLEVGFAYVSGGGLSDGERHLIVKVTGTF